jgi:RNA polymerase sigma-70 factor, ECF subfamily
MTSTAAARETVREPSATDQDLVTDDLNATIDAQRHDIVLLCYRFLGSIAEAEEAAQETALRAWRGRAAFRGDASVRTWLHRIATRVCLDMLRHRTGRRLPQAVGPATTEQGAPPAQPATEIAWLEPLPESYIADAAADPAARYDLRESVSLAFIAALQVLPPRQRAVLLLRDVLGWSARETAAALDQSVAATNSSLHRARAALRTTHHRTGRDAVAAAAPSEPVARRLLDAYVRAWAADDVDGLIETMREDVRLAMPPSTTWFDGRSTVEVALRDQIFGPLRPGAGYAVRATSANRQPAVVFAAADAPETPLGVQVLDLERDRITGITVFLDPDVATRFRGLEGDRES